MTPTTPTSGEESPLWGFWSFGRHRLSANEAYWWENLHRRPNQIFVFQYAVRGTMSFRDARGTHAVPEGSAVVFAYGEPSAYGLDEQNPGPFETEYVLLTGAGSAEHWQEFRRRHGAIVHIGETSPLRRELGRLVEMGSPREPTSASARALAAYSFVVNLFRHFDELRRHRLSPVERAIEEMVSQPFFAWSLKELAHRYGTSREHLSRTFAERVGQSPHTWLNQRRVQRVLDLLRDTDLPVQSIAEQTGFASLHTLSRQVRAATGHGPGSYRALFR